MIDLICSVCKNVTLPSCMMICISVYSCVKYTPLTCWPLSCLLHHLYNTSCIPGVLWLCLSNSIRHGLHYQLGMACIRNSWISTLHLCGFTILVNYIQRPLISSEMSFSTVPMNKFLPLYNIFTGSPFSVTQEITRGGGGSICSKANSKLFYLIPLVSVIYVPVSLEGILGGIIHRVPPFFVAVADPGEQFSMMWYRLLICGGNSESPLYSHWGKCSIFANRTNLCDHSFAPNPLQLNPGTLLCRTTFS